MRATKYRMTKRAFRILFSNIFVSEKHKLYIFTAPRPGKHCFQNLAVLQLGSFVEVLVYSIINQPCEVSSCDFVIPVTSNGLIIVCVCVMPAKTFSNDIGVQTIGKFRSRCKC